MERASPILAAGAPLLALAWPGLPEGFLAGAVGVLLLAAAGATAGWIATLRTRDRDRRELQGLIAILEELRAGRAGARADAPPGSLVGVVADSVNRLGRELMDRRNEQAVREEGIRALLDVAQDHAIISTDGDWEIRTFSSGATHLLGWPEDEIRGHSAAALFAGDGWKELLPKLVRRSFREQGVTTPTLLLRRDGTTLHARLTVRQLRSVPGDAGGYLLLAQDVAAQHRLEDDLRVSEARYRGLVEGLGAAVFISSGGILRYANEAFGRLVGQDAKDLLGTSLRDRLATSEILLVGEYLAAVERGATPEGPGLRFTLVDGSGMPTAFVRLAGTRVQHEGRGAVLGVLVDETSERRAAEELKRSESILDAILEAAPEGTLVLGETPFGRTVRVVNGALLQMLGMTRRELLGASEDDLLRALRERGSALEPLTALLTAPRESTVRETLTLGGESPRRIDLLASPLVGPSGGVHGRIVSLRDVTEQKAVEEELEANGERLRRGRAELEAAFERLRAVHEETETRSAELNRLNDELRTLDAMKSEFLSNVSHELQTPLVSIRGYTEMILKGRLGAITEEQRKGLTLSLKSVDRLIAMIDNLLAFSRMDRDAAELVPTSFPLKTLIEEAVEVLHEKLDEKGISVRTLFEDPELLVQGDRNRILQVFLNLLTNAIKFNRDGGRVEIVARGGPPGFARIEVQDTGVGIAEEDLQRVFDRFYRVEGEGKPLPEGTGIGLAIVRNVLRLHGCSIEARSKVGEGTTFTFTLPLPPSETKTEASPSPASPPQPPSPAVPEGQQPSNGAPFKARFRILRRDGPKSS